MTAIRDQPIREHHSPMGKFTVSIDRQLAPIKVINGVKIEQPSGFCYVDVTWPTGLRQHVGYIGSDAPIGSEFAPLSGIKPDVVRLVQREVKAIIESRQQPAVEVTYIGNEPQESAVNVTEGKAASS